MKRSQLYLSSIGTDAAETARGFGLGLELAQFCTAMNLDDDSFVRDSLAACRVAAPCRVLHAPFADLAPAAIDPMVRDVTVHRLRQAVEKAGQLGIDKLVVHAGYVPHTHFPVWFAPESAAFWRDFMQYVPAGVTLCLENVMEPTPEMLLEIVQTVDDPRFRLCLDVGHANTEISDYPLENWLRECAPYLAHLHLHNNRGGGDLHAPLFDGSIDYLEMCRAIDALAPAASVTLELLECRASVEWMIKNDLIRDEL